MKRFLALGDSYTIGEGVAAVERWPAQLAAQLQGEGIDIADPVIVARTGWTTDELLDVMDHATFEPPYALVTLLVGANNQYRGWPCDEYRHGFRALLQRAITLAGGLAGCVVGVSIPDWGVTPFARHKGRDAVEVAAQVDAFNTAARAEAGRTGAHWADVTATSRAPASRDELVADSLHPSAAQYARWVRIILPAARAALASSS